MRKKTVFLTTIIILAFLAIPAYAFSQQQQSPGIRKLIIFHSPTCHKCQEVKNELIPEIQKTFKDKLEIESRYQRYREL